MATVALQLLRGIRSREIIAGGFGCCHLSAQMHFYRQHITIIIIMIIMIIINMISIIIIISISIVIIIIIIKSHSNHMKHLHSHHYHQCHLQALVRSLHPGQIPLIQRQILQSRVSKQLERNLE